MNVLVVLDHPRRNSFTGAVLDSFVKGLEAAGHSAEIADLRSEGFDPRIPVEDEPSWGDQNKVYSQAVLDEQARIERNDAIAFVFPVFWWSFPATTKGWIDRVWNYGWAYSSRKLSLGKAVLIAVNGGEPEQYAKRGYDEAMRTQLLTGIMNYCGIPDASLEFFYDALASEEIQKQLLDRAFELGRTF